MKGQGLFRREHHGAGRGRLADQQRPLRLCQVYLRLIGPWKRAPQSWGAQDFSGIMAACWNQNMGVLAIRVLAGGPLASAKRPEKLAVLTSGTDIDNEMRCAAAVHQVLGLNYGTPAQAALRFVLGNRDFAARVIGISSFLDLNDALLAVEQGPLPAAAIAQLKELWATDFR